MKVIDGTIASPLGFSADGLHAGFKKRKMDFGWIVSEKPASVAGVYTTNKVIAAPLIVTKTSVKKAGKMRAIVVNSGVANSCTGTQGLEDAYTMQEWTAEKLGVEPDMIGVASTGIIGELLPMDTLKNGLSKLVVNGNANDFAKAILTTDTATKTINMATMLGFITCDANISSDTLQLALSQNVEKTFNQITVDGDTSTNDMVLVMSNGCALNDEILPDTPEFDKFSKMLNFVMQELAKKIAKDGEGANKLIQVDVVNAPNALDARMMAKSVVGSSLVKTAIFGEDPNWGRILAAVGYAGVDVPVDNVDIMLGGLPVMLASSPVTFDDEEMKDIMHGDEVTITVDLHSGQEKGTAWGCDLSYDYVKINALYHT